MYICLNEKKKQNYVHSHMYKENYVYMWIWFYIYIHAYISLNTLIYVYVFYIHACLCVCLCMDLYFQTHSSCFVTGTALPFMMKLNFGFLISVCRFVIYMNCNTHFNFQGGLKKNKQEGKKTKLKKWKISNKDCILNINVKTFFYFYFFCLATNICVSFD